MTLATLSDVGEEGGWLRGEEGVCTCVCGERTAAHTHAAGDTQVISVWQWTADREGPAHTAEVTAKDTQTCVRFNPSDPHELVTNGAERVIFWNYSEKRF